MRGQDWFFVSASLGRLPSNERAQLDKAAGVIQSKNRRKIQSVLEKEVTWLCYKKENRFTRWAKMGRRFFMLWKEWNSKGKLICDVTSCTIEKIEQKKNCYNVFYRHRYRRKKSKWSFSIKDFNEAAAYCGAKNISRSSRMRRIDGCVAEKIETYLYEGPPTRRDRK